MLFAKAKVSVKKTEFEKALAYQPDYRGYDHRLKKIGVLEEVSFWNDSKSDQFFGHFQHVNFRERIIWIGGGRKKGDETCKSFVESNRQKNLIQAFLIGEVAENEGLLFDESSFSHGLQHFEGAVGKAYSVAKRNHPLFSAQALRVLTCLQVMRKEETYYGSRFRFEEQHSTALTKKA